MPWGCPSVAEREIRRLPVLDDEVISFKWVFVGKEPLYVTLAWG